MLSTTAVMRNWTRVLLVFVWVAVGAGLLAGAFFRLDAGRLADHLGGVSLAVLGFAAALDVGVAVAKATKWHILLRPVARVGVHRLLGAFYCGAAAAAVLPFRLDEFVRAYAAHRFTRVPGVKLLGSMALERLVDFGVLLLVLLVVAWILPLPPWLATSGKVVAGITGTLVLVLAVLQALGGKLGSGRAGRFVRGLAGGSRALGRPGLLAGAVGVTFLEWGVTLTVTYVTLGAAGVDLPFSGVVLVVVLFMGSFATPLAPAGIGVFEVAMRLALPALFDVPEEAAVAAALAIHTVLLAPVVLVGAVIIVVSGIRMQDVRRFRARTTEETP